MKKFIILIIFISNFLSAGALVLNNQQTQDINETLATLLVQEDGSLSLHHATVQKLMDGIDTIDGGWTNSKYNYIYRILSNTDDKIGVFIITKINNPNSNIVKALNMRDRLIILLDINQEEKVLFSGYKEELNTQPIADAGVDKSNYSDSYTSFDASQSNDEDGEIVKYEWSEDGSIIGEGVTFNKRFGTGTHTITLSVTDDRNAISSDEVIVQVYTRPASPPPADTTAPIITITGDSNITINKDSTYSDAGASTDDESGVTITNEVNSSTVGTYQVRYNSTDSAGNSAIEKVRTVNVEEDTIAPTLTITDDTSDDAGVTLIDRDWIADVVTFSFSFSETVTGFEAEDITLSGAEKGDFSGSGDTYTLEVTPPTHSTTQISISVASDKAVDGAGNGNETNSTTQSVNTVKAFITTWKSNNSGTSEDNQVKIGTNPYGDYSYNYSVDWGDDTNDTGVIEDINHTYDSAGEYTIKIIGDFPHFFSGDWNIWNSNNYQEYDGKKLLSINQWGTQKWKSMRMSFCHCENMQGESDDKPILSNVTDMNNMFSDANTFNQDIGDWNVSSVTDMSYMFFEASAFNQDIGNWNVSSVTNMGGMFFNASIFNQDISNWDISNVNNMSHIFRDASAFNQDIGDWNISSVTNMGAMFFQSISFNQNIGDWNVSSVTDMGSMFYEATAFNQDISNWNVSNVTNMSDMFYEATIFNQDIGDWNVSSVTDMVGMFSEAISFNQDISSWDVSSVTLMGRDSSSNYKGMFEDAIAFTNQDLSGWNVDNVIDYINFMTGAGADNIEPNWVQ